MSWRNENVSGRKRTATHGIVRIPKSTTTNVNITGQLGQSNTILPFFSEIRGVITSFISEKKLENKENLIFS